MANALHHASFIRSHKDSNLWIVVSLTPGKPGGMIDQLTTRMSIVIKDGPALCEGDVCRMHDFTLERCGHL